MIEREDVDGVAVVGLARGKVNALDLELLTAITETFETLDAGAERAVVLTGAGRAFSAGVDLWRIADGGPEYVAAFLPALTTAFEAVFSAGKPVVAAINGPAIAGGCIFAACCDHRVIADGAGIGVTELLVGVPFPTTALEILAFAAGDPAARRAVLSGTVYGPAEALQHGLVDEVAPGPAVLAHAISVARRLADTVPADTYRQTKRQLRRDTAERIARHRVQDDPRTRELWTARVADGGIRAYMTNLRSRPRSQDPKN